MLLGQSGTRLTHDTIAQLGKGQMAWQHLHARSSIVAAEGDLRLEFRDHSLAWLGDAAPDASATTIALRESDRYTMQQSGMVAISAMQADCVAFVVQSSGMDRMRRVRELFTALYQQLARVAGLPRASCDS
ncbi:MAG: hypothetical protein CPDRYMAC_3468 [uncultured Paraburkholderia sp.]|nr:MAG: hypothetical protein CPDRYDRY_3323 [uncultured Paraburkholderia sp.]CAH2930991.1 MAG: hypothetical protein CPDRYMAC_3468 [uncultured Paraburkholderia sp.]